MRTHNERVQRLGCLAIFGLCGTVAAAEPVDFQRQVRPILADRCFKCHGPDEAVREGKLRLDQREQALRGGESGLAAIVPGRPEQSELMRRLTSSDPDLRMPPPDSGAALTKAQADLLRQWIAEGAKYETHWAYVAPRRPTVPAVQGVAWPRTPIDAFILARLEAERLAPAPPASKETWLRRLSLDLTGLPPELEEIDAFLADDSAQAHDRQIERLLASPHFGERWGRHWLDAARYADSDGYEKDKPRNVWMYRDWVVGALNRDLPYDQFLIEQLAGDLLPNASQDQRVATGFLRNSMINEEGGIDPEQFRMEAMFDRMDAIGKGILGLAINCCQCHNHKYDPLTQEDYYRLFACFNDTHEAQIAAYTPPELQRRAELFQQLKMLDDQARERLPDWPEKLAAWERAHAAPPTPWTTVPVQNAGDNSQRYVYHADGSQTAWGYAPTKWTSKFAGRTSLKRVTAIRLENLTDPNLPLGGPGRSPLGLFALSEFVVEAADAANPEKTQPVRFVSAAADFGNDERPLDTIFDDKTPNKRVTGPVALAIDGKDLTAWGIDAGPGRRNVARHAVFTLEKPLEFAAGAVLTFQLKQMHGGWNSDDNQNNNLGRFRFSVTDAERPAVDPVPLAVRTILAIPPEKRSPAQQETLFRAWWPTVPELKKSAAAAEAAWQRHPAGTSQLTFTAREQTRPTFLLARGDFLKPTRQVEIGVPSALHPLPANAPRDRLGVARWLASPESPTTARALVNRVWQAYFGSGLVASSEDLGVQSEPPTHPELLDWLAVEFVEKGWKLKDLHRLIARSAVYRQAARVTPELLARDPQNRWLARGPRQRVDAETIRDVALAASGLLNRTLGGPPVYPPAPEFLFKPPASYGPKVWREETGPNRYRRAVYTFRFRSVPYPALANFDAPNGDASCVRRPRSNTPLQALTTLNEPLFVECARGLAQRTLAAGGKDDEERLAYAFRRCTGRRPEAAEQRFLLEFLAKQIARFSAPDAKPWELAAADPNQPPALPAGATAAQAAAWTAVSRLLLNLDETITKE